jgi:hypothetical protein
MLWSQFPRLRFASLPRGGLGAPSRMNITLLGRCELARPWS